MDNHYGWAADDAARAIRFTGNWREYLPIAATNALLIIVTLGIYRFWATARQRRYLWSRTQLIDDTLEWTGTGKEMFVGFVIVVLVLVPFFLFLQFLFPALIARGHEEAAVGLMALFYAALMFLGGFARFRALRYRLSRSWWHGIRGGSDDRGWSYAAEYFGRMALVGLTLFILFPWAATRMWTRRWSAMSFGPLQFRSNHTAAGLKRRWAGVYLMPVGLLLMVGLFFGVFALAGGDPESGAGMLGFGLIFLLFVLVFYLGIPLLTLHWYAKFFRLAAERTSLGNIHFSFDARTRDWLMLFLGNIALAIVTLGFGLTYWGYRNWSFMVRHLNVHGEIDLSTLTRSDVHAPGEAEGFADMFDVGAI